MTRLSLQDGRASPNSRMKRYQIRRGTGRTEVRLSARYLGSALIVTIYNDNAHLGAVAVGDYDHKEDRAYSSVITLTGHRDDEIAKKQAHAIARHTKKPVCVIAGVHVDEVTKDEIGQILNEVDRAILALFKHLLPG